MKAIIITENKYPCEDAGALRQHAFAKLFQQLGYDVTVLGYGKPTDGKVLNHEGVEYTSFRPHSSSILIRLIYRYSFGRRVLHYIKKRHSDAAVMMVISLLPGDMKRIERFARKNNQRLIHDSVEWYSPEEFSNGKKNFAYKRNNRLNAEVIQRGWRVVAISRFLEEHFKSRCDAVARIPVIMDIKSIPFEAQVERKTKRIRFAYVGMPGTKDYLATLVKSFALLTEAEKEKVEFHIIGTNLQQLISVCGADETNLQQLTSVLRVHGRVSHEEAVEWIRNSDYTMMLRDESLRYAKAGFPTKIVESLAYGTPPVCNLSSDLAEYLVDGENSFIVHGHSAIDVKNTIAKVIQEHDFLSETMRINARKTAEAYFNLSKYENVLRALIDE